MQKTWLIILVLLMVSCFSKHKAVSEKTTTQTVEKVRDTIFHIPSDQSSLAALIDCQNQVPIIKVLQSKPGSYLNPPKYQLKEIEKAENPEYQESKQAADTEELRFLLEIECEARAQEMFASWKETHIREQKEIPMFINELTFWQQAQINLGRLFLLLLIILSVLSLLKRRL